MTKIQKIITASALILIFIWIWIIFQGFPFHVGAFTTDHVIPSPTPTPFYFGCNSDHQCVKFAGKGNSSCEESSDCKEKVVDCDTDGDIFTDTVAHEESECATTPTPTPLATPSATPTPYVPNNNGGSNGNGNGGGTPNANSPQCTQGDFPRPYGLTFVSWNGDKVTFSWTKSSDTGIDKQIAYIGLKNGVAIGSQVISKDDQTITFNYVPKGTAWANIVAIKGACSEETGWIDP